MQKIKMVFLFIQPFGDGLATIVVPQLRPERNVNTLFLWKNSDLSTPVHSFFGHKDVVLNYGKFLLFFSKSIF